MSDDRPGEEIGLEDEILVALLKGLAMAIPRFAEWLFGLGEKDSIAQRVRDELPEKGRSRLAAERLEREMRDGG